MAKELKNFSWTKPKKEKPKSTYPWDQWSNGSTWQVFKDKDYKTETTTFRIALYNQAKELGMKVRTRITNKEHVKLEGVIFQFYTKGEKPS